MKKLFAFLFSAVVLFSVLCSSGVALSASGSAPVAPTASVDQSDNVVFAAVATSAPIDQSDNAVIAVIASVSAAVIIAAVAIYFIKRKKQ